MTAYWPTSAVARHLTPPEQAELADPRRGITRPTMAACHRATSTIPADTTLTLMYTEGIGSRRIYLQFPSFEQWMALERGGFVEVSDDFGFILDALH
jgi:hypothetical protein